MSIIDWTILLLFFAWIIWDGIKSARDTHDIESLLLAKRSMPWWAVGLSVMATQASAISFIGTAGQAYKEDMQFIQTYFGLPLAMIILAVTLVPLYHKLKVYTAYEALESKFGLGIRLATSMLFLISRGLALGTIIAAPAYVLSLIFSANLTVTIMIIGASATIYTTMGGIGGVIRTDIKQMAIMMVGLVICIAWIFAQMPEGIGPIETLQISGSLGKLKAVDFSIDASSRYTIWSGLIAGLFLALSYFGSDQTQVQRYLTARSLKDAKISLMLTGIFKIPMMFLMLIVGSLLYVFYVFNAPPESFYLANENTKEYSNTTNTSHAFEIRKNAAYDFVKDEYSSSSKNILVSSDRDFSMATNVGKDSKRDDTNYILPYFILHEMPPGIIGLIIAAIFAAALSSIDSGLNSLAATSVVDWLKRLHKVKRSEKYYLNSSRLATICWGAFATLSAIALGETGSIIELVNMIGSYFYGPIFGIFALLFFKNVQKRDAAIGLIGGMICVFIADGLYQSQGHISYQGPYIFQTIRWYTVPETYTKLIGYLWLNPIGTLSVLGFGYTSSLFTKSLS